MVKALSSLRSFILELGSWSSETSFASWLYKNNEAYISVNIVFFCVKISGSVEWNKHSGEQC